MLARILEHGKFAPRPTLLVAVTVCCALVSVAHAADKLGSPESGFATLVETSSAATHEEACSCGPELWVVNTRRLPTCPPCGEVACEPEVCHFVCGRGWLSASVADIVATDQPGVVTTILVHGNDTDKNAAIEQGQEFFSGVSRHNHQ